MNDTTVEDMNQKFADCLGEDKEMIEMSEERKAQLNDLKIFKFQE